jgi:EmrB/QacA subfamily drug resistance transporter
MSPDPRRWKALALLCVAYFMVILDSQIVILALPSIQRELGFAPGGAQWVMSAYLASFGGLLLLGGRSADLLGRRRMFMIGTAVFLVASLACGLAWTATTLIAARVVQGVSAAIMTPTALSILMNTFDEGAERNRALGLWSAVGGAGATAALLVGGPLTDLLGWPWIFFINVPVAAALLVLAPVLLTESRAPAGRRPFGASGTVMVTGAILAFIYGLVTAPERGWGHPLTLGALFGSGLLVLLFMLIESRSTAPIVPLRVFRSRMLVGGNLSMLLLGMTAFGTSLVVSLYAQRVLGLSAWMFGLGTAVLPVMAVLGSYAAQVLITRTGLRRVASTGMILLAVADLLLTRISVGGSYFADVFPSLLIFGCGLGTCAVAASIAALAGVPEQQSGLASGLNTAAFQLGGALGVAIVSTVAVLAGDGGDPLAALTRGYRAALAVSVSFPVFALVVAFVLLRPPRSTKGGQSAQDRRIPEPGSG